MKPKKRYRRRQGHRQTYTEVEVVKIATSGGVKAPAPKKVEVSEVAVETKVEKPLKKAASKKETKIKKVPAKKTAKKPAE